MSNTFEILNPVRELTLARPGCTQITATVRELPWRDQKLAMDRIIAQINSLTRPGADGSATVAGLSLDVVIASIKDSAELAEWLLVKTTTLTPAQIAELSVTEFFWLLEHAIDLNVVGYITGAKKAFGRIGNFVGKDSAAVKATPPTASPSP